MTSRDLGRRFRRAFELFKAVSTPRASLGGPNEVMFCMLAEFLNLFGTEVSLWKDIENSFALMIDNKNLIVFKKSAEMLPRKIGR